MPSAKPKGGDEAEDTTHQNTFQRSARVSVAGGATGRASGPKRRDDGQPGQRKRLGRHVIGTDAVAT